MQNKVNMAGWSEAELLQTFLPVKSAANLLREYRSVYNILFAASETELGAIDGVGKMRAKRLLAIREMIRRWQQKKQDSIKIIHGPEDVVEYFRFLEDKQQEEFWVLLLNTKNAILQAECISVGTLNAALVTPREVFHAAIRFMAASVIAVHNHPSGHAAPSAEDADVTERLVAVGKVMDIPVLDHIIIGRHSSYSMQEHNKMRK